MELKRRMLAAALAATAVALALPAAAQQKFITVASTTSTEQSGLFKHMLPIFEKKTGIQVRVVALGTGQALDMGKRGDADVAFVHDKAAEEKLVAEGYFVDRRDVMYNDFVLIGPKADPAKVGGGKDIVAAFRKIKAAAAPSFRAATRAARTRRNCACGRWPASTWPAPTRAPGTARPARAWGRR